jgi:tRNA(fMet)-specific endonuclease VapC
MEKLLEHQQEIATATVVWHELLFGCYRLPDSKKRRNIEEYLQETELILPLLSYDHTKSCFKKMITISHKLANDS